MGDLFVRALGEGVPVVLVHGSVFDGEATWHRQLALADRFRLVIPDRRGYGGSPEAEGEDFERNATDVAELLGEPSHLVGHSYGAIACLLAAAMRPDRVLSLSVIEPPAFGIARGNPDADAMATGMRAWAASMTGAPPEEYLISFIRRVGGDPSRLPSPLPQSLIRGARILARERAPDEAVIPFPALRAAPFPKLVFSGGHSAALDAVCDVLVAELPAERSVIAGAGHSVQMTGQPFNDRLAAFLAGAVVPRPAPA